MNFRGVLNRLKPSEVIELETVYAVNIIDVMMEILPYHDPHDVPWFESFSYFEPADLDSEFMEQEAAKGKGAFVQALWTQYAIPKLYFLVYKAWRRYGSQNLTTWTRLAQAVLDGCFGHKWPDCVFQVPDSCSICLSTMHWPETTQCGHAFHLRCLLRHLDCRQRTTIVFGNLGRWPDRVTYYEPDYPYTILFEPNYGVHIPRSFGKTVIVFTSHLDLTWDQGVELRFFQVGRSPSHRVWEAYQPHMTDAYSVDLTDCLRVADVYVKWLTGLDDWEMHRDDPVPWRIVGLQHWKRALEQHVQRSHEKALAHGMPSDVTLLDHI
ncbi:uncharacterized protein TNCV_2456911 [Trichonephila clavipes]|nr:uncharacterized protein TNCV_2456911 [Trichonephila clavipes]